MNICIFSRNCIGIASGLSRDCLGNGSVHSRRNFDFFLRLHRAIPEETSKHFRTNLPSILPHKSLRHPHFRRLYQYFFCEKTCIYQKKAVSLQVELIFMPTRSNEISLFLAFCIEQYKQRHHLTGEQSMRLMDQYNVLDYLQTNYEPLHTQNAQWIMEDIDEFINLRKQ